MGGDGAAERLWDEFRGLYEAAGSPTLGSLAALALQQRPSARLTDSTLSDWLNRKSIPALRSTQVFLQLVAVLESRAKTRSGYQPRYEGSWQRLLKQAQEERTAAQGSGRPPWPGGGADAPGRQAGWLLGEVGDPFALEVHRPVQPDQPQPGLPDLPPYVPRDHDEVLARRAEQALGGRSTVAVLVGASSTGKTRACWEVLGLFRGQVPGWRLWHPIDPSRPEAALLDLADIGPRTVIWLNEAQDYLGPRAGLGERVAAGLRELLRDPARGPVMVLATLWPSYWDELTARPAGGDDPHAHARELLTGHDIPVPDAFTAAGLRQLRQAGDPRLAAAAENAEDGRVTEFLAGAPELLARYRNALSPAKALIHAAMDARRLGMGPAIPHAFLEAAAPGYLTDAEWDLLGGDWLEQALAYTAVPCKGVRGPLTRIRPRPGAVPADADAGPAYRLADYLDQYGRRTRRELIPPASFWVSAGRARPGDLPALGQAAKDRGLLRDAARLYKQAADRGDTRAAARLIPLLHRLAPADQAPAWWAAAHAALGDSGAVAVLLRELRKAGAGEQVTALIGRDPAVHASLADPFAVAILLDALQEEGAGEQVTALIGRDPAAHAALDNPYGVAFLLRGLRVAGAGEQSAVLAARAAAHAALGDPGAVAVLLREVGEAGAGGQSAVLAARAAAGVVLDDPLNVALLLAAMREVGAGEQFAVVAVQAAAGAALGDNHAVGLLLEALREAGAGEQSAVLIGRIAAAAAGLDDPAGVAFLLETLREAGAQEQVTALIGRDPAAHAALDDPYGVARLLVELGKAGAGEQVTALIGRDPAAHAALDDPYGVARLLVELGKAGAGEQVTALIGRDPAAHAALGDPRAVASLLAALREAGAGEQFAVLAARAATDADLADLYYETSLLEALQEAGAGEQAAVLIDRLPAAGLFGRFLELGDHQARYRFGREPDGSPSPPWGWNDLESLETT